MERSAIAAEYLQALQVEPAPPSMELLRRITAAHVDRFPFTSIGPRLGVDLPLDLQSLRDRIIVGHRGGYCFEQNRLMFEMLQELGFDATLYLARVVYGQDGLPPLTHRVTVVDLDGERWIVDVGFGGHGPRAPIPMSVPDPAPGWRVFRAIETAPAQVLVQMWAGDDYLSLYRFDLAEYSEQDCEVGHFYTHRHPDGLFVNHLVIMRTLADEVRSLRDRSYVVMRPSGDERRTIADAQELHAVLTEEFGLDVTREETTRLFESV